VYKRHPQYLNVRKWALDFLNRVLDLADDGTKLRRERLYRPGYFYRLTHQTRHILHDHFLHRSGCFDHF